MMFRRRPAAHRRTDDNIVALVGWVFADTLLALAVVFLATQESRPPDPAVVEEPPRPIGVDSRFVCLRVQTDPAVLAGPPGPQRDAVVANMSNQLRLGLARPELAGRRAGIVLSFGVAATPGEGIARAAAFNAAVLPRFPGVFRRADGAAVASRPFWDGGPKPGKPDASVSVNIYPVIDDAHPPLTADVNPGC